MFALLVDSVRLSSRHLVRKLLHSSKLSSGEPRESNSAVPNVPITSFLGNVLRFSAQTDVVCPRSISHVMRNWVANSLISGDAF